MRKPLFAFAAILLVVVGAFSRPVILDNFLVDLGLCEFSLRYGGSPRLSCVVLKILFDGAPGISIAGVLLGCAVGAAAILDRTGASLRVDLDAGRSSSPLPTVLVTRLNRLLEKGDLLGVEYHEATRALELGVAAWQIPPQQTTPAPRSVEPPVATEPSPSIDSPQASSRLSRGLVTIIIASSLACAAVVSLLVLSRNVATTRSDVSPSPVATILPADSRAAVSAHGAESLGAPSAEAPERAAPQRPEGFPEDVPRNRTRPPSVAEWAKAPTVKLEPAGCFRKVVREWLKLNCSKDEEQDPGVVSLQTNSSFGSENADYFAWMKAPHVADVVMRMVPGRRATGSLVLQSRTVKIGYDWSDSSEFPEPIWE